MTGRSAIRSAALILSLAIASPALARTPAAAQPLLLQQRVEARLAEAGPGVRFGLVVATEDGRELVAIAPDARFIPASNTKMFTTAAAFATLSGLDRPDVVGGATVRLEARGKKPPNVVVKGYGDSRLSSSPDCVTDCLAALADAVAATKVRVVHNVVGDASFYPDERWSPGMSWNNLHSRYGTAASALTLDDNELIVRVSPAAAAGAPPSIEAQPYYEIDNRALTTALGETKLDFARTPGGRVIRVTGSIAVGAKTELLAASIDDPAHYAAWRLKALLEARGVRVTGAADARYRLPAPSDDVTTPRATLTAPPEPAVLARLVPPPLIDGLSHINKVSQNLHAELMLRRIGRRTGTGSIADGVAAIHAMLERAGVQRAAFDFADGSGMSTYNRLSPRGTLTFLRWIAAQPWGEAWKKTLPIGGVDGTLSKRFRGTPIEGRVFAKTGTLNATNALSGSMIARSGRSLFFSAFANDVPGDASATRAIDAVLVMISEAN